MSNESSPIKTYSLSPIPAGGTAAQALANLNLPIKEAQAALNDLSLRFDDISTKGAVVCKYMPLASSVATGDAVYYNYSNARFEPALAKLRAVPGFQGESIEDASARVEGIVIEKTTESDLSNNVFGSILISGYWESSNVITSCIGNNPVAGTYYLSPTVAGKLTLDPGQHLRQPVLSYYGNGKFSVGGHYLAHDNHFHASATLNLGWTAAATIAEDKGVDIPVNEDSDSALYGYVTEDDPDCVNLGELADGITAVFKDGSLVTDKNEMVISDGILWSFSSTSITPGSVTVFNHYPFAYGSPVVRKVESTNDSISVNQANGTVTLIPNDFVRSSIARSALAVSAINGRNLSMTPVVTAVNQGPGILAVTESDGSVTLSSSGSVGVPLDAYSINHNGTHPASDGTYIYIMYPKGRNASLVMSMPVTNNQPGTSLKAFVWGLLTGTGAAFSVDYYWAPMPLSTSSSAALPSRYGNTCTMSFNGSLNSALYSEASGAAEIDGNGMLYAKVTISNAPTDDIKLLRMGFKLEVVESTNTQSTLTVVSDVQHALINSLPAASSLSAFKAVKAVNGELAVCQSSIVEDCDQCIGLTIAESTAGASTDYIVSGILSNIGQSFTPGSSLYIDTDGSITQVSPSGVAAAKFIQKIGMAITATSLQIDIRPGILKS